MFYFAKLDRKRIPQTSSGGRKCSVAVTAECSWYYAGWNVDGPQRALSAVTQGSNHLPNEAPVQTATGELEMPV